MGSDVLYDSSPAANALRHLELYFFSFPHLLASQGWLQNTVLVALRWHDRYISNIRSQRSKVSMP